VHNNEIIADAASRVKDIVSDATFGQTNPYREEGRQYLRSV